MSERILFVDDEPNVLAGFTRLLRKGYEFDTAVGGAAGLAMMADCEYAVIVSDMRMPEMSGEEFLAKAYVEQPDAVQMILSGQANLDSTVTAVNDGNIFRFLLKPVERASLTGALDKALRQYRLLTAERELLQNTLAGAVGALTEVLSLVSPAATRRTGFVVEVSKHLAPVAQLGGDWQLRLAAMLSGVGFAAVPTDVVERSTLGEQMTDAESSMLARHPDVTAQLLGRIPRLGGVSTIIRAQAGAEDAPQDLAKHVHVLDIAIRVAEGLIRGQEISAIISDLESQSHFSPTLIEALHTLPGSNSVTVEDRRLSQLLVGMTLRQDVTTRSNVLLASAGTILTGSLLERMRNFSDSVGIEEPITVSVGKNPASADSR